MPYLFAKEAGKTLMATGDDPKARASRAKSIIRAMAG